MRSFLAENSLSFSTYSVVMCAMVPRIAKKHWGQHFLRDENIAHKIVSALGACSNTVVEVGPGTGVLTALLVQQGYRDLYLVEIDRYLASSLKQAYPALSHRVIHADFLQLPLATLNRGPMTIIGNFPYNISSQILFKVLADRQQVKEVIGTVQREVALRFVAQPGSKVYGVLSVLLQAFYDLEYLFTVPPQVFTPPPKVQSAVIRLRRNHMLHLPCDEHLFFRVVKASFSQRRKTLRNALKSLFPGITPPMHLREQRAEQLRIIDFVELTNYLEHHSQ